MKTRSARTRKRRAPQRGARLGQHFLTGAWAAAKLAESAGITKNDTVLEIGPGKGALTKALLKTGARIIAIEKDEVLAAQLDETFAPEISTGNLSLIKDDIRNFDPRSLELEARTYVVAANIPYYITGEIIRHFLTAPHQPRTMALLVQKEVAERIVTQSGRSGDKKESILSLSVKAYGEPRIAAKVGRGNFSPPPSVDSAILVVEHISRDRFKNAEEEEQFFTVVRAGFASKRKLLASNLAKQWGKDAVSAALHSCDIAETARAEDVPLPQWLSLARAL